MNTKTIADLHNINYIILYTDCPDYILFTAADAIRLIEKIRSECFPVCHIEVTKERKGKYDFDCSWECHRLCNESMTGYMQRSCNEAIEFVNKLSNIGSRCLFELDIYDFEHGE